MTPQIQAIIDQYVRGNVSPSQAQQQLSNLGVPSNQIQVAFTTPGGPQNYTGWGSAGTAGTTGTTGNTIDPQIAAQKQADRQNYINRGVQMQKSGASNADMLKYLAIVPNEFRFDVAQNMGIPNVGTQGTVSTTGTGVLPATASPQYDNALNDLLNNPNLTADQKSSFKLLYDIIYTNDADKAKRLAAALDAATTYSAPLFKAQTLMYITALQEGLSSLAGDYAYKEQQQKNIIRNLEANLQAIQGYGSFEQTQDYKKLITSYTKDLETTQENMATTGFTSSTRRSKAEQLLGEQKEGLVESGRRTFGYNVGKLTTGISDAQNTMAYLTSKETQDRIAALREAEAKVGTSALQGLPNYGSYGYTPVGGVGGTMPREQYASNLEFAKSFIF